MDRSNLVSQLKKPLRNSTSASINSYNGHKFMVKFKDERPGTEIEFIKGPSEEKIVVSFNKESGKLEAAIHTKESETMELVETLIKRCQGRSESVTDCLAGEISKEVGRLQESLNTMTHFRDLTAAQLRNYTCADDTMTTSVPDKSYIYRMAGHSYNLSELVDHPSAKIWTISHFATDAECDHLIESARPRLSRATVAGDDGDDALLSDVRRAQQASFDFSAETAAADPVW
jgi:hypothetical protein